MTRKYQKMTAERLREWWAVRAPAAEYVDEDALALLIPRLTDLEFVRCHAERGLAFDLAAHCHRVVTLWERLRPTHEASRPCRDLEPWVRDCVSAALEGTPDPHPGRGAGPALAALTRRPGEEHDGASVAPQHQDGDRIPEGCFGEEPGSVRALETMRAAEQAEIEDAPTGGEDTPLRQLRAVAAFVGGNVHILAKEPRQTIPLAFNSAASGLVAQRAEAAADSLDFPWFARNPRPPLAPDRHLLSRTLSGHAGPVQAVAMSGNGAVLVSGGEDRTVRVWDVTSGQCIHVLQGHQAAVERLALTPDGSRAVSSARTEGRDASWRLWDLNDGVCLGRSPGGAGPIDGVALSADGRIVVTVGECALRVWDAIRRVVVRSIGDSGTVNGMPVAITPDAKLAATAAGDDVVLWDLARGRLLRLLAGHTHMVKALAYSANGKLLASASHDDRIRLWDVTSGRCLREMSVPRDGLPSGIQIEGCEGIEHLCLSRDGRVAATGSAFSKYVRVWDLASGECVRTLLDDLRSPAGIAMAADATLAATAAGEELRVWDIAAGSRPASLPRYYQPVHHVASSRDGTSVVTLSDLQPCALWDGDSGRVRHTHETQHDHGYPMRFSDAALTADGGTAVVSAASKSLLAIDTSGGEIREMSGHELSIQRVCVGPCDRLAVSGDHDHNGTGSDNRNHLSSVNVWAIASGRWLRRLRGPDGGIRDLAPLPDGRRIVSCDGDHIHVWDWAEGKSVGVISGRQWAARWLEAGPDGTLVATMGESPWVHVWDLSAGRCVAVLEVGQGDDVMDMAFTPDGRRLLVGSRLGTIQVCELRT
ncbi:MAG: WD40 repeat domain-containing protein, partial [Gemmataceae bacterium]